MPLGALKLKLSMLAFSALTPVLVGRYLTCKVAQWPLWPRLLKPKWQGKQWAGRGYLTAHRNAGMLLTSVKSWRGSLLLATDTTLASGLLRLHQTSWEHTGAFSYNYTVTFFQYKVNYSMKVSLCLFLKRFIPFRNTCSFVCII